MISVIIPTYNRFASIDYIIKNSIKKYQGSLFSFEIHDSSTDNQTELLCNESDVASCVSFFKYNSSITMDEKAKIAISNCEAEYFFLVGDGLIYDFNRLEALLVRSNYSSYPIIHLEESNRIGYLNQDEDKNKNVAFQCDDDLLFAKKYFSHLTMWGSTIVKTCLFHAVLLDASILKYGSTPWWIACYIIEIAYKSPKFRCIIVYTDYFKAHELKKGQGWAKYEQYYKYVFEEFNRSVFALPSRYDKIKTNIIRFFRDDALVNKTYLRNLRKNGLINLRLTMKYKESIKIVEGYYGFIFFLCLIPPVLLKLVSLPYRAVRKAVSVVFLIQ